MVKRMKDEFSFLGINVDVKGNENILSYIEGDGSIKANLSEYDFVLFLDKDIHVSHLLEKTGIRIFNSPKAIELCDDKMMTYIALSNHHIKMPKTIPGPLNYSGKDNPVFIENVSKRFDFPMVCKECYGSMGKGVYLINSKEELLAIEKKLYTEPRLYQELIKSSWGFDYRMIVIGGKFRVAMKRCSLNGDFRSNIALGGEGNKVEMKQDFIDMAEKVSSILGLDYCGIDLLEGENGEPVLCEVNSNAFIQGIESVTGYNVAKDYAEYIKSVIEK